jgi:response regulator NasT
VVVIDDHAPTRAAVLAAVTALGGVVLEAETAQAGVALVAETQPDVAVLAVGLPDGDGVDAAAAIMERAPCPIIVLTSRAEGTVVQRARLAGAMAYLVKPLRAEELEPAIELAIARFAELVAANREVTLLRKTLSERKTIERAKGFLMERLGLGESAAFRLLQKTAMDRRVAIAELAEALLKGEGPASVLDPPRT